MNDLTPVERTFLFTDLERSTRLWDQQPEVMKDALGQHLGAIGDAVRARGGSVYSDTGDGLVAVFDDSSAAAMAAADAQRATMAHEPTPLGALRSRMGVHTGECYEYRGRYSGRALNRCARLHAAGHATQILLSGPAASLAQPSMPDGYSLSPLGEFWLRDLREAELVFQLVGPGLPADFPPIRSRRTSRDRLPAELTPLVGRDGEVESLVAELEERRHRLIVLTGEAGVGKTRLALRVADRTWWSFRDGVYWYDVAATVGDSVAAGLAGRVGAPVGRADLAGADEVAKALATNELLVVLDNCETDVSGVAQLASAILAECPEVVVLATSRESLGIVGERHWAVAPLAAGEPGDLEPAPAVELFIERAGEVAAGSQFDDSFRDKASTIVAALAGVPLAIEHAAASLDVVSIDDLVHATTAHRLDDVPGFERMTRSIDRSTALLVPDELELLVELSVFRSAFTPATAAAVTLDGTRTSGEIAHRLAGLARKSLIQPTELNVATRYRMSEPMRAWVRSGRELPADLLDRCHRHHRRLALEAGADYRRGDQRRPVVALAGSWDDIRVAMSDAIERGLWDEAARLVLETHEFGLFSLRPDVYVWADLIGPEVLDTDLRGAVLGISALGAWQRGEMTRALDLAAAAKELPTSRMMSSWALRAEMNTLSYLNRMGEAAGAYISLLGALATSDEPFWRVDRLASEAIGFAQIGAVERAAETARRGTRLAEEIGNQDCLYWSHYALALALGPIDAVSARSAITRAVEEADSIGSWWNSNNGRLELLLLNRRHDELQPEPEFDIESAQIAWELLSRFDRARATTQVWQVVMETVWMLARSGHRRLAADLHAAVRSRPRMPRPEADRFERQVEDAAAAGFDGERPTHDPFASDRWIIDHCREGLAMLLGSTIGLPRSEPATSDLRPPASGD